MRDLNIHNPFSSRELDMEYDKRTRVLMSWAMLSGLFFLILEINRLNVFERHLTAELMLGVLIAGLICMSISIFLFNHKYISRQQKQALSDMAEKSDDIMRYIQFAKIENHRKIYRIEYILLKKFFFAMKKTTARGVDANI